MRGYVLLARQILKSEIWLFKPSWWLKVWEYILLKVNYGADGKFRRGEGFFTREMIHHDCGLKWDGVRVASVENVTRWLKETTQITTRKTTRGMIIHVENYDRFQNIVNYKTTQKTTRKTNPKQKSNDTISKRSKEVRTSKSLREIVLAYKKVRGVPPDAKWAPSKWSATIGKIKELLEVVGTPEMAIACIQEQASVFDAKKWDSWGMGAIVKYADEWLHNRGKAQREEERLNTDRGLAEKYK